MRSFVGFLFVVLSVLFTGCSTTETDDNDPVSMMKDAEDDISSGHYLLAIDKLQLIKNKHPYSKQATDAQLRLADVYFLQENYIEAAATYEAFVDLHPKDKQLPYALYRQGLSYFEETPTNLARDVASAYQAREVFESFLKRFPKHDLVKDVKVKLDSARNAIAGKEMYIADFYMKREYWEAAKNRYQKIVHQFSDLELAKEAEKKLKKAEGKTSE